MRPREHRFAVFGSQLLPSHQQREQAGGQYPFKRPEFLRRSGYFVVTESREEHALQLLDSLDYEFDAVLVQVSNDPGEKTGQLLRDVRQRRPPVKSILQIVGRNADEVDTSWIRNASLTVPPDLPEAEFGEKLRKLFDAAR